VTGVLPVALLEATKANLALLQAGKEYVTVMRLHRDVSEEQIRAVLQEFTGTIFQRPPMRSSVKRQLRRRTIYYIEDIEIKGYHVLFRVGCQAGTYIRKLCYDIGEALGTGAHMAELRRTRVGPLTEDHALTTLHDLKYAHTVWVDSGDETLLRKAVRPIEEALSLLPKIYIRDTAVDAICHGADLAVPGILRVETGISPKTMVGIYTLKGEIVALAHALMSSEQMVEQETGVATDTLRVIMAIGTYPKMWRSHRKG